MIDNIPKYSFVTQVTYLNIGAVFVVVDIVEK